MHLNAGRTRQNVIVDFTCMMKIIGLLWHFIMSDRKIQANSVTVTPFFFCFSRQSFSVALEPVLELAL